MGLNGEEMGRGWSWDSYFDLNLGEMGLAWRWAVIWMTVREEFLGLMISSHLHPGPPNCIFVPSKHHLKPIQVSRCVPHLHPGPSSTGSRSQDSVLTTSMYCLTSSHVSPPCRCSYSHLTSIHLTSHLHQSHEIASHLHSSPILHYPGLMLRVSTQIRSRLACSKSRASSRSYIPIFWRYSYNFLYWAKFSYNSYKIWKYEKIFQMFDFDTWRLVI